MSQNIASADGKLGILLPGMGAVATTLIAGVYAVNKGISKPIGSTSQMGVEGKEYVVEDGDIMHFRFNV